MTFDEAIERVNEISEDQVEDRLDTAMWLIGELRQEYAPTVEMTSGNKANFIQEGDSLSKLLTGYFGFDVFYWEDFSERKVAQAWLHPETIKVID